MLLDTTTRTLELILGTAQTTTAMPIVVDYVETTATTHLAATSNSASNGTTLVTILSAPAASTQRKVNSLTVYNADSVAKIVTVRLNDNTTLRNFVVVTLQVGETLGYTDVMGWYVQTTAGVRKYGAAAAIDITNTPAGNIVATNVQAALNELDTEKALLAGSASQVFSVSPATAVTHAVRKDQTHITTETPAFSAYQSTSQSVNNTTVTKVQLQTEEFDTAACFDLTTNYRFTPNIPGYYSVTGCVAFLSAAGTGALIGIYKNGAVYKYSAGVTGVGTNLTCLVPLNGATDYIELFVYQNSGGAINTQALAERTFFQGVLVRSL